MQVIHKPKPDPRLMTQTELYAYIHELEAENARLEEGYQKSVGVIAATDCVKCKNDGEDEIDELKTENEALNLLIEWAEKCDFGYDNFPEEYERYKDEIEDMGYIEGMIHIAKRVYQEKSKKDGESE